MDKKILKPCYRNDSILDHNQLNKLHELTPIIFGASAFQYLNAGSEIGLFELLYYSGPKKKSELMIELSLKERAIDILLLGNTSLNLINKEKSFYKNSLIIQTIFENNIWDIFKDLIAFEQYIVYLGQFDFTDSLRKNTNIGLQRISNTSSSLYKSFNKNKKLEKIFYNYMNSWTRLSNYYLIKYINFNNVNRLLDVGGGTAINAIALAKKYPKLKITVFEIDASAKIAQKNIQSSGLSNQINVIHGDIFKDQFPTGYDCVLFSHQLVIWTPEENIELLHKAYKILSSNGLVIIFNSISNDDGKGPLLAALDSVYFASIPSEGGMIYSWNQYEEWLKKSKFQKISRINCHNWTPHGIIKAYK